MKEMDNYFLQKEEPVKSCLLALKELIIRQDKNITAAWKYGMPFFCFKGKMFCYLWVDKGSSQPYLGIVEGKQVNHPKLLVGERSRMKIILFNPLKNLPVKTIESILNQALDLYRNGVIKLKSGS